MTCPECNKGTLSWRTPIHSGEFGSTPNLYADGTGWYECNNPACGQEFSEEELQVMSGGR